MNFRLINTISNKLISQFQGFDIFEGLEIFIMYNVICWCKTLINFSVVGKFLILDKLR